MAIVATVGGASSNSYVTLLEAQAYFDARFGSDAWDDAEEADQEKALLQAARQLSAFRFQGYRNNPAQALPFPRGYPLHCDPETLSGVVAIPTAVKQAQCEQALALLKAQAGGEETRADLQAQGVTGFTIGQLTETFASGVVQLDRKELCKEARALLVGWISNTGRIVTGRELRPGAHQIANGPWPEDYD